MRSGPLLHFRRSLATAFCLTVAAALLSPLRAQVPAPPVPGLPTAPCLTEVVLYVDKTESTNARETTRAVFNALGSSLETPGPLTLTVFAFSGEVPIATFIGPPNPPTTIDDLLDRTILQEASSAVTLAPDYVALFSHMEDTARNRPIQGNRRIFIVISDFSTRRGEAEHENALPTALTQRLAALRQILVAGGKQRFLAVRTRPRQEPSPSLQNDLLGEIAKNFPLVEDETQLQPSIDQLLDDDTPLQVQVTFNPTTSVYSLTLANPSCTRRTNIEYFARTAGDNTRLSFPWCPTSLNAGDAGTCTFAPDQIVLPPLPDTCLNVWLRVSSQIDTGAAAAGPTAALVAGAVTPTLTGTANQPILAGNCVFLSSVELDLAKNLSTAPDLAECFRAAGTNATGARNRFVTCLKVRGRLNANAARLRILRTDDPGAPPILDRPLPPATFNGPAFHGGERILPVFFTLPRWKSNWLCTASADLAERKLSFEVVAGGVRLANGLVGRKLPVHPEADGADLWRKLLPWLLILLFLAGPVANYLRTASLGLLDAVVFILGVGLLALALPAYGESGLGDTFSAFFGENSSLLSTIGLLLLALCYWLLFAKGFFDRKLSAQAKVSLSSRIPLVERRRKRFWRAVLSLSLGLLLVLGVITLLWLYPRELKDCRYSLIDLPANTPLPPVNLPANAGAP